MVTNRRQVAASVTAVLFLLVLAAPGASVEYAFYEIRYPDAANGAITAAVDVNNAGTVLGSYFTDEEDFGIPFFWQDGAFSEIEFSEDELAEVLAMNNAGDLAGVSLDDSGAFGFVWDGESLDTFTVTSSPIPGLSLTVPTMMSLGDDLTVIGAYWDLFTEETGVFQWSGEGLEILFSDPSHFVFSARSNHAGTTVGTALSDTDAPYGFILQDGEFQTFLHPDGDIELTDINGSGAIIGTVYSEFDEGRGFVYEDGEFSEVMYPGSLFTALFGINDHGWIVGEFGMADSDDIIGFLAIPVPEPSSMTLMGVAVFTIALLSRKRR